mmetsp:Transcript_104174/g.335962  ORF Transcript_104174/g.335962 Transcript_104174/m.335962 type:complete len:237 (-) Transcript_104174:248-958(-)
MPACERAAAARGDARDAGSQGLDADGAEVAAEAARGRRRRAADALLHACEPAERLAGALGLRGLQGREASRAPAARGAAGREDVSNGPTHARVAVPALALHPQAQLLVEGHKATAAAVCSFHRHICIALTERHCGSQGHTHEELAQVQALAPPCAVLLEEGEEDVPAPLPQQQRAVRHRRAAGDVELRLVHVPQPPGLLRHPQGRGGRGGGAAEHEEGELYLSVEIVHADDEPALR